MGSQRKMKPRTAILIGLAIFFVAAVVSFGGPRNPPNARNKAGQETYKPPTDPSLYVGTETCKTCHADMPTKGFYEGYENSPHFVTTLDSKNGPGFHGCEACHGPGKAHVDGGGDKTKIFKFETASTQEINSRCLACHAGGTQHMNAINSIHTKNDVSCISCHSPHHAQEPQFLLVKSQPELCYT
ncbi:MAG: cytochrome c3 family protein, partial [Candidatus Acidiferrum sp.]